MKTNAVENTGIAIILFYIVMCIAGFYGWIMNIVSIFGTLSDGGAIDPLFIARIAGIFAAPFGAILGYI